ncbi:ABC transporter substrate-binding protein [Schumannella luteola]|uniref:Peptide/nickel transport system substrate-binding protein n=1 Tax=Schumannella luteola TaxID=472059 RepID=A0A852YCQ7_9MICO|nr:ABC transporter substrate-binding protein [Schumannella luteola]NYG98961.1 peptide/nickel transport system substrate-binding protein [Schumannella luteola]TPX06331.1 peptide ABC transporter substrate-binding protein [Schumannella luteola]
MTRPLIRVATAALAVGATALALTGCATGGSSADSSEPLVIGTTDAIVSLDPAGAWDRGSFTPQNQIYQHLLSYEPGNTTPVPEAAESCDFDDATTYSCTVKKGLKFSNGHDLTASDVVFSFERILKINDASGPAPLLSGIDSIEKKGELGVVFHLKTANDQTFPYVLSSMGGPIVDEQVFPADKLLADAKAIGSGPYAISDYSKKGLLSLTANTHYDGTAPKTKNVVLKAYADSSNLKLDIQKEGIDIAYRSLTSTDVADLEKDSKLQVVSGPGGSVRFLVFNKDAQPGADDAQKLAIRQAVATLIDRDDIAENVFKGTYAPAYSLVLDGQNGATKTFADLYGAKPSVSTAKQILADAGVSTPVTLPIQYTSDHYGPDSSSEYATIKSQLEESGLFTVDLQSTEWTSYVKQREDYPAYQLGFFPDYPDPDNFLRSGYSSTGGSVVNGLTSPEIDAAIEKEATAADPAERTKDIEAVQELVAKSAGIIPLLQGQETVVAVKGVTGLKDTLDATYKFRFAALARG